LLFSAARTRCFFRSALAPCFLFIDTQRGRRPARRAPQPSPQTRPGRQVEKCARRVYPLRRALPKRRDSIATVEGISAGRYAILFYKNPKGARTHFPLATNVFYLAQERLNDMAPEPPKDTN
jgi:hypothetical protein